MRLFSSALVIIFSLFCLQVQAYQPEEGNVTATLGPYFYKTDFSGVPSRISSPWMGDGGLIVNGDLNKTESLEIALFHLNKRFLRSRDNLYLEELTQIIHVTMGYKRWITSRYSFSIGFYSEYPLGPIRVVRNDFPPDSAPLTSAHNNTEYGFDLAAQAEIWQWKKFDLITEARYAVALTPHDHEKSNHYGFFVGLRFLVQSKFKPKSY